MPFRKVNLKVDRRALIPRPETELIVDTVRHLLDGKENPKILEIGVGTGAICLSLMQEIPGIQILGVDLSIEGLSLALENASKNALPLTGRLMQGDAFSGLRLEAKFDLIVSNPPYVGRSEFASLAPEVRDHDPELALIGGREGWEFPWKLIAEAQGYLRKGGFLVMEVGSGQAQLLMKKAADLVWASMEAARDYQDIERFVIFRR